METIKEVVREAHKNSRSKGFYDLPSSILEKMLSLPIMFTPLEYKAVKDAFIGQRLMLITSELGEALEANRKDRIANLDKFENDQNLPNVEFKESFEKNIKDSFEDELADATIRIGDLAGWLNIDLSGHIDLKHQYNTERPHMHGKAY